jgi:hypothetical protein
MIRVTSHDRQIIDEGDGGNLSVNNVLIVGSHQHAPPLSALEIKRQDSRRRSLQHRLKPSIDSQGLLQIASNPQSFDTAPDFADYLNWNEQVLIGTSKEIDNARIRVCLLAQLADRVGVDQKHP